MEVLIKNIKDQAKVYLQDAGEFFPFGAKLMSNGEIIPVGVYVENYTNSQELVGLLEKAAIEEIKKEGVLWYAIGIDVNVDSKNALMIKLTNDGKEWYQGIYNYNIIDKNVTID